MSLEDFVVLLCTFCCLAERSKVFLLSLQVVVGPLGWEKNDECVAICLLFAGALPTNKDKVWVTPWTQRLYDCTMGYQGEDL